VDAPSYVKEDEGGRLMDVNERSPDHYRAEYQHWDFVIDAGLGYLEGNATKYLARYRRKGAWREDLEKALHYIEKLAANVGEVPPMLVPRARRLLFAHRFVSAGGLANTPAGDVITMLATWEVPSDLIQCADAINRLIERTPYRKAMPVPAEDSNKHAERENRMASMQEWEE
jgi:hypothetical protein